MKTETLNAFKYPDVKTWTVAGAKSIASKIQSEADARRLAECWNACAGMADPVAEIARLKEELAECQTSRRNAFLEEHAARLAAEQQVQQLREALKFYAGNFPNDDLANWQERICADEGDKAKQALADTDQQKASRNS